MEFWPSCLYGEESSWKCPKVHFSSSGRTRSVVTVKQKTSPCRVLSWMSRNVLQSIFLRIPYEITNFGRLVHLGRSQAQNVAMPKFPLLDGLTTDFLVKPYWIKKFGHLVHVGRSQSENVAMPTFLGLEGPDPWLVRKARLGLEECFLGCLAMYYNRFSDESTLS